MRLDTDVTDFATVLSPSSGQPAAPASMRTNYDAFGRTRFIYAEDGALTTTAFHAASTTVCDPLDNIEGTHFTRTCTTSRSDGFGRVIDQILVESTEVGTADDRFDRLYSYYRADGVVLTLVRTQTTDQSVRPSSPLSVPGAFVRRDFVYDSVGRRLGSFDPDTDDPTNANTGTSTWRYRFNRVGDLVGVRDPRGCGQNFLYDLGGRLVGEQYVSCGEAETARFDQPDLESAVTSGIGEDVISGSVAVDVRYDYDTYPSWTDDLAIPTLGGTAGRATGVMDRGQRSAVAYDDRGNAIWTARQMALMPFSSMIFEVDVSGHYPVLSGGSGPSELRVTYDAEPGHTYIRTSEYDHAGRGRRLTLPLDPDFDGPSLGGGPVVSGELELDPRGLPIAATAYVGEEPIRVLGSVDYDVEGQVETRSWGGTTGLLDESFDYDIRNRPIAHEAVRAPTMGAMAGTIGAVEYVAREQFGWDEGSNLVEIRDTRPVSQWAEGHRPRNTYIGHDSLYRVAQVSYEYRDESGYGTDTSTDWRDDAAGPNGQDPMQPRPASMIGQSHGERIQQLDYEWDYLGNQIRWLDDAFEAESRGEMFYERGIGEITNGNSTGASSGSLRPSALYLSTNIDTTGGVDPGWNGAGWVEVEYGISGNVASFTVHGQCHDNGALECSDSTGTLTSRIEHFRANCACAEEQHYRYRWDELNRLVDGLRYDRATGGSWTYGARMRYRYDGANQRTVKQSFAATDLNTPDRCALYVYPGDFERRGLTLGFGTDGPTYLATTGTADATETQYLIAGARIVWDGAPSIGDPDIDRNRRATVNASDLLGTTAASLDLESGALLEVSTYYPNGARENLWTSEADVPLEPMGFTGKEADEEIGVTYFGERWLIPRLGRWATPDPLHVHASGGGEALNSYHYVSGNLLQAVDPLGLYRDDALDGGTPYPPGGLPADSMYAGLAGPTPESLQSGYNTIYDMTVALPTELAQSLVDHGHEVLDGLGMLPVVGEPADAANAVWYAFEGDMTSAGFSMMSMVPLVGNAVGATRIGRTALRLIGGGGAGHSSSNATCRWDSRYGPRTAWMRSYRSRNRGRVRGGRRQWRANSGLAGAGFSRAGQSHALTRAERRVCCDCAISASSHQ